MESQVNKAGFTLIEMMIVIGVIAILATVGVVAYSGYVKRSHNAEATSVLADVRIKQEAYRATFHKYADLSTAGNLGWVPNLAPTSQSQIWPNRNVEPWDQLGIRMAGSYVYFVYTGVSGAPGDEIEDPYTLVDIDNNNDFWFGAQAVQDLDEDGECEGFAVGSGQTKMAQIEEANGNCPNST